MTSKKLSLVSVVEALRVSFYLGCIFLQVLSVK